MKKISTKRLLFSLIIALIGINLLCFGLNIFILLDLGFGPFDSMTMLVLKLFKLQEFGNAGILLHGFFALFLLLLSKKVNLRIFDIAFSVGSIYIITRFVIWYKDLEVYYSIVQFNQYLAFVIAFLILNFGLFLISKSNLIIAPFDKLVVILSLLFKRDIGTMRVICDLSLLLVTFTIVALFNLAVPLNLVTIFIAIFTGLNIKLYNYLYLKITKQISTQETLKATE